MGRKVNLNTGEEQKSMLYSILFGIMCILLPIMSYLAVIEGTKCAKSDVKVPNLPKIRKKPKQTAENARLNDILSNIPDTESAIIANGFFSATTIHPIFNAIETAAPITTANGVRIDNNITTFLSISNVPCIALVIRLPKSVNIFPVTSKTLPTKRTKLFKIVNKPFKKVPSP